MTLFEFTLEKLAEREGKIIEELIYKIENNKLEKHDTKLILKRLRIYHSIINKNKGG